MMLDRASEQAEHRAAVLSSGIPRAAREFARHQEVVLGLEDRGVIGGLTDDRGPEVAEEPGETLAGQVIKDIFRGSADSPDRQRQALGTKSIVPGIYQ